MKITITKRVVSLLAVLALLMTMFTGMVFNVSAEEIETTTNLVPITDASNWTGRTDKINGNNTFAAVKGEGSERVITTADTYDFGNKLKVSGTLIQRTVSGSQTAKSYVKVGDFRFEIEDDLTSFYVRAVIGEEVVYEESWTRAELDSMQYKHFYKLDFNATIDNTAKTVTLDYLTGNRYAAETVKETGSGTYTGDYSFDGVNCVASFKSNWLADGSNEVVGVLGFSVTKYETVADESSEDASSEDVSSEDASSEDVSSEDASSEDASSEDASSDNTSSSGGQLVERETTSILPTTDASKWTGDTGYISDSDLVLSDITYTKAGSFVIRDNSNAHKQITTVDTFNLGNNFKVSGTLVGTKFRRSDDFYAYAYAQVGDFKFVIGDERDETDANRPKIMYVRAYMGEELVYEKIIMQGNTLGLNIFDQVNFNAIIDNNAKTVTLDFTTGAIGALENNEGSGTYTGDYSFDAVTAIAAAQNNFVTDVVNLAVAGLSLTKCEIVASENTSSEATSSEDVSSDATSSEVIDSDYMVETVIDILPDTNAGNWTGDTGYISNTDVVINGYTYAPAGSLVVNENTNKVKAITTADIYDLGDKFKVSGALSIYQFSGNTPAIAYATIGDLKFEIGDDLTNLYVKIYIGNEVLHYKTWQKSGNSALFRHVKFNVVVDNIEKMATFNYTTGAVTSQTTNNGESEYTGAYSFNDIICTASVQNNWMNNNNVSGGTVNIAVSNLAVIKYEMVDGPVTFTVLSENDTYGTVTRSPAGDVHVGDEVTISATPASGYEFKAWVDQNNKIYTDLEQTAVIKAGKTNYYKALFVSTQTVVTITVKAQSGRIYNYYSSNYPTLDGMLSEDETIRRAVTGIPGYELAGWVDEQGNTVEATTAHTENITVTPVYGLVTKTYKITVDGVSEDYAFNTAVLVTSEVENFSYWSENEEPVTFANPYRFFVGCDRVLTSVANSSLQPQPIVKISNMWNENGYDYVLTEWAVPSNCKFVAEGVMMTKNATVNLADKTLVDVDNDTIRVATTKYDYSVGQYMIYTYQNSKLKVKAFLIYKDAQGVERTIYTQVKRSTVDYYASDNWQPVDVVSAEYKGEISEGCQWTTNIVFAAKNNNPDEDVAFLCLDTAGPYKTTDGGKTWKPSSLGWGAAGSQCVAIDPYNSDHVIGAGNDTSTATSADANGVYLSLDGGDTWKHVLKHYISSPRTYLNQFVFDPTSYNESTGMCMTIYWSSEDNDRNSSNANAVANEPKLFKSTDGGVNWTTVNTNYGGCHLEIAKNGNSSVLYAAKYPCYIGTDTLYDMGTTTIYKSTNGGRTFTALNINDVRTFDVQNNVLYVSTTTGFYKSTDYGSSFTKVNTNDGYKEYTQMLAVSPNGQNMVMQSGDDTGYFRNKYYSTDGGQTWTEKNIYGAIRDTSFMPVNPRVSAASFSSVDQDLVISNYGDTIIRSEDGGKTWVTSNLGYNVICTGEITFNVNPQNQNLMFVPSQDYNGAFSTDGGQTFKYLNWSGKSWGGFTYGGYIFDENTMFVINSDQWWSAGVTESNNTRYVYTTFDGGETFNRNREDAYKLAVDATQSSLGSVKNNNIAFVGDLRTTDKGKTFTQMNQVYNKKGGSLVSGAYVIGVLSVQLDGTSEPFGRLYGRDNTGYLVYSDDDGATWYQFADFRSTRYDGQIRRIMGMSCDKDGYVYVFSTEYYGGYVEIQKTTITEGQLSQMTDIVSPIDSQGKWNGSLAVDYYTGTLYLGSGTNMQPKNTNIACMWRSEDGGKTWIELSVHLDENLEKVGNPITEVYPTGDVTRIIINYQTNEVFAVFTNHGIWKIGRQY